MTFRRCLGAIAVAAICTSAVAQEAGSRIRRHPAEIDDGNPNAGRLTMEQFAACLVARSKVRVTKYAFMRADDPDYYKYMRGLFDMTGDNCLSSGSLTFNAVNFRGAVFQALYDNEFSSNSAPTDFAGVADTWFRQNHGPQVAGTARMVVALEQFGECVARADGRATRDLLKSVAASSREAALFNQLGPTFSACIPAGETFAFSKIILKGALAEGIYWLSKGTAKTATPQED